MGYFDNIKFNDITVGTPKSTPSATPSFQQKVEINRARLTTTPAPIPQPAPAPTVPLKPMVQQPKTGMGKVFAALNKPSEWTQSLLTKGKTYEEALGNENSGYHKFNEFVAKTNLLRIIPSYKKKQDEKWEAAMKNDTAKKIAGSAARFVFDPLNFIPFGKVVKVVGKGISKVDDVVKVSKMADKMMDWARTTPAIYKVAEKFSPFFRNPEFGKLMKDSEGITSNRLNDLYKLIKTTAKNMSPAEQTRIGQLLEGGIDTSAKYEKLAAPLRELTEKIGKEAVDLGILSRKSFNTYKGVYMKHIFEKYIDNAGKQGFVRRVAPGIGQQFSKMRKGAEGYIREFSAPTFAGIGAGIKDIEAAKFYKKIASDFGAGIEVVKKGRKIVNRIVPEGFEYAPKAIENSKIAKFFKNKALPNSIIEYINKTSQIKKVSGWDKLLNAWKAGKTIYNPAYHIRNVVSNQILSDMSTGKGLVQTASDYIGAVRQYIGKGNQKFVNAAEAFGLIKQKRFGAALDEFLDASKVVEQSKGAKILDFPRKLQTVTEETSKLNVFKSWIEKLARKAGKSVDDALKDPEIVQKAVSKAEEAIFSPYRLSQTERGLAKDLIPFYSFTRQVVPFTAKTLVTNPARIAKYGKMKREVENFSKDQARPGYAENFIRLPWKNKQGENAYLDPTYIYPFGNVFEGGQNGKLPFGLGFNPIFTEVAQQMANKDFYYDQPIAKYESKAMRGENLKARAAHVFRTGAPQFVSNAISKILPAATGQKDFAGRERSMVQALADTIMGIKTSFISEDKGVLDQFYQQNNIMRSKQNDIKKVMQDNSMSDEDKRMLLEKILK